MDTYERLTRGEIISLVREKRRQHEQLAYRDPEGGSTYETLSGISVFGERDHRRFEESRWPIRIFDLETLKYLAVNDAALKLYGYTRQEFLALTPLDTRHPSALESVVENLSERVSFLRYLGSRRHSTKT